MSKKSGYSRQGFFGTVHHYDNKGHKIGESRPGLFGGYNNYDAKGHKVGESRPGLFGGYTNYDAHGHKIGSTSTGFLGSENQYDAKGHKTGSSYQGITGQSHYGSFDPNSAGGAAGAGRDERWMITAGAIAASKDDDSLDRQTSGHCSSDPSFFRSPRMDSVLTSSPTKNTAIQHEEIQRYIIASNKKYYRTSDLDIKIGDCVVDSSGTIVTVRAVVSCVKDALPKSAVSYVKRI